MITITMMNITITITLTIITTAQDCRMLKGITMMMIVLLMKACIESSQDISFVFVLFLGLLRRVFSYNVTTTTTIFY